MTPHALDAISPCTSGRHNSPINDHSIRRRGDSGGSKRVNRHGGYGGSRRTGRNGDPFNVRGYRRIVKDDVGLVSIVRQIRRRRRGLRCG